MSTVDGSTSRCAPRHTVSERYTDDDLATILDYADRLRPLVQEQASTSQAPARSTAPRRGRRRATALAAPVRTDRRHPPLPTRSGHLVVRGDPSLGELFRAEFL